MDEPWGQSTGSAHVVTVAPADSTFVDTLRGSSVELFAQFGTGVGIGPAGILVGAPYEDPFGTLVEDDAGSIRAFSVSLDCSGNGTPDGCDIANGTSLDVDGNGVPDECD